MRRLLAALLIAAPAGAQQLASARGTVYDSLHAKPLAGALVAIMGTARSTISDNDGRFRFDSLAPNTYTFTAQHDALDSAGMSGLAIRAKVGAQEPDVQLAIPSFATIWRAVCGQRRQSLDTGFVFGTVRDVATGRIVQNAQLMVSWTDITADKKAGVHQRQYHAETASDEKGSYGVCGIPRDAVIRVQATADSRSSGTIDVAPHDLGLRRVNLSVASSDKGRGTVKGVVTGIAGVALPNARVTMEEMPETRTDSAGRFILRNVPAGTREIEVFAIGMSPVAQSVDITPNDTTDVTIEIRKAVSLAPVKVSATRQERIAREIGERKRGGLGYMKDSSEINAMGTPAAMLAGFPNTQVVNLKKSGIPLYVVMMSDNRGGQCQATIFIDGIRWPADQFTKVYPPDVAVVEVYPRAYQVPFEFQTFASTCGVVVIWTKAGLR